MSDNIKLVIEIPKELYEALLNGYEEPYSRMFSNVVKNGIPLDDVKAKIDTDLCYDMFDGWGNETGLREELMDILDNIGKAESEDRK